MSWSWLVSWIIEHGRSDEVEFNEIIYSLILPSFCVKLIAEWRWSDMLCYNFSDVRILSEIRQHPEMRRFRSLLFLELEKITTKQAWKKRNGKSQHRLQRLLVINEVPDNHEEIRSDPWASFKWEANDRSSIGKVSQEGRCWGHQQACKWWWWRRHGGKSELEPVRSWIISPPKCDVSWKQFLNKVETVQQ